MFKDNTEVVLTREEALRLHRKMWTDMQKELGDCPTASDRVAYEKKWLEKHGYTDVLFDCFLCEYANDDRGHNCALCPVDWSPLSANRSNWCTAPYRRCKSYRHNSIFENAPISEILALWGKEDGE